MIKVKDIKNNKTLQINTHKKKYFIVWNRWQPIQYIETLRPKSWVVIECILTVYNVGLTIFVNDAIEFSFFLIPKVLSYVT